MEATGRKSNLRILAGASLVAVGLLGGILVTLIFTDQGPRTPTEFHVVERVDLGGVAPNATAGEATRHAGAVELNELFQDVANRVVPSVVSVQVQPGWLDLSREWFNGLQQDEDDYQDMPRVNVGSGVVISPQGYIVTNYHVIERASGLRITFADRREYDARVVGHDQSTDLAVLKIDLEEGEEISAIMLGNVDKVQVGEWVLAIGSPFRLHSTITAGIVSALGRQVNIIEDDFFVEDFIQTDAAINPGNSGGALVNLHGELVGISTAIATESGSYEGYGFAVPANLVERISQDLIAFGEVRRGYMGVTIVNVDARQARGLGLERIGGVYLDAVEKGSAADRGGLREGDVITKVAGRDVNATNEMQSTIARHRPGDQLTVEFWRDGQTKHAQVQLLGKDNPGVDDWLSNIAAARRRAIPDDALRYPGVFHLEHWGLVLRELTERDRNRFSVDTGVFLVHTISDSVAGQAQIPDNVVVEKINGAPVRSVEEAVRLFGRAEEDGGTIRLSIRLRDGLTARYSVTAPDA